MAEPAEYQLKEYLLLLATLVATVTYAAGLNLPGGSWLEDEPAEGRIAGDSILRQTNFTRYIVFYYFNAISFAASLLVGLLLLLLHRDGGKWGVWLLRLVRGVMVVDLLGLTGAYAFGGSHDGFTTTASAALASAVIAYVAASFLRTLLHRPPPSPVTRDDDGGELDRHKILIVLAIFAATIAYVAGLNPPGGFWRNSQEGDHAAGDPVLQRLHPHRYKAFYFCNTAAFTASLTAIMIIVDYTKLGIERFRFQVRAYALYGSSSRHSSALAEPTPPGAAGTESTPATSSASSSPLAPAFSSSMLVHAYRSSANALVASRIGCRRRGAGAWIEDMEVLFAH
ncbi:unnamed protein product [Urochloa humidicola]